MTRNPMTWLKEKVGGPPPHEQEAPSAPPEERRVRELERQLAYLQMRVELMQRRNSA